MLAIVRERAGLAWIEPMKPSLGMPADESGWAAELKWDGVRTGVATDGSRTVLRSSTGRDVTAQYPELADLGRHLAVSAVLDGEVVVFDGDRPSFQRVLQRLNVDTPNEQTVSVNPVVLIVFDLLVLDGLSLLELPYRTRRHVLEDLMCDGAAWRVPPVAEEGSAELLDLALARDYEGIMLKRLDSPYRPGARSADWRKVKIRQRQEFVVGGWVPGRRSLEHQIGSLVLGVWDGDDLVVAGRAGSGLTDDIRSQLMARFVERDTSPFVDVPAFDRPARWVAPEVIVEAEYSEWRAGGHLRFPVFVGIRDDKDPRDVIREIPPRG